MPTTNACGEKLPSQAQPAAASAARHNPVPHEKQQQHLGVRSILRQFGSIAAPVVSLCRLRTARHRPLRDLTLRMKKGQSAFPFIICNQPQRGNGRQTKWQKIRRGTGCGVQGVGGTLPYNLTRQPTLQQHSWHRSSGLYPFGARPEELNSFEANWPKRGSVIIALVIQRRRNCLLRIFQIIGQVDESLWQKRCPSQLPMSSQ